MTTTSLPAALSARRWGVILAAGLSWTLVTISMLVDPVPEASGRELIAGYAADSARAGLHTNLIHYGFALLAPVVYGVVGLVRGRGAWLANLAGVLAVIGLSTLPGLVMLDLTSTAAVRVTDVDTALAIEEQLGGSVWFLALALPALACAILAVPVAGFALWRAGLVPGVFAVAGLVAAVAPNLAPTWWLGFGITTVWTVGLAYLLWRLPASAWDRRTTADPHHPAPEPAAAAA